jgi:hypothetical protein
MIVKRFCQNQFPLSLSPYEGERMMVLDSCAGGGAGQRDSHAFRLTGSGSMAQNDRGEKGGDTLTSCEICKAGIYWRYVN